VAAEPQDGCVDARPKEEVMTTLSSARPLRPAWAASPGRSAWRSTRAAISGLIAAINRARKIRRSVIELSSWDDRMLSDIGLTRGDIKRVVRFGRT
jgi:uncharacterized protein YjiS (DUF1127 family)